MSRAKPSLAIWIDPGTQEVTTDFMPQTLHPAEYGVVLSVAIVHIARLFCQSNPGVNETEVVAELLRGIQEGIKQRTASEGPMTAH